MRREPESGMGKRADAATRSLRVLNLPQTAHDASTTEGLLQQAFEKHAPVKRLEVFVDKREAVVEFETAAVRLPSPVIYIISSAQVTWRLD